MRITWRSLVVLSCLARMDSAQVPRAIADDLMCATCRILVGASVRLGASDGPGALPGLTDVPVQDGRGRFWVTSYSEAPWVFDAQGRFLQRVGRVGAGPGEYQFPSDVLPMAGDSVLILDPQLQRATVVSPTLGATRQLRMEERAWGAVVVRWPDAIASGINSGVDAQGRALLWSKVESGSIRTRRSFGPTAATRGDAQPFLQTVAPTPRQTVWASYRTRYEPTEYDTTGRALRAFSRTPSWFAEPTRSILGTPTRPPGPSVAGIEEDSTGLLWIYLRVPGPRWREAWPALPPGTREVMSRSISHEHLTHTRIEVVDPSAGRVVARTNIPAYPIGAVRGRRLALYRVTEAGVAQVEVVSLRLER